MINFNQAIIKLTEFQKSEKNVEFSVSLQKLIDLLSVFHQAKDRKNKLNALIESENLNSKILIKYIEDINKDLYKILKMVEEYLNKKIQTNLKINRILKQISLKEIFLIALRARKDYGPQEDLGLGKEPYLESGGKIKLHPVPPVQFDEHGKAVNSLDDRHVIDGRGVAPTLRHQIEKYDPQHRPWRNFFYREYNAAFDFWKSTKNVELHLIFPDIQINDASYDLILDKWVNRKFTYVKDLLIIYHPSVKKWEALIRNHNHPKGFVRQTIEDDSPLMKELKKITNKNARDYDKSILERIILEKQPFVRQNIKNNTIEGFYFARFNNNFYEWIEKSTKVKTSGKVKYLNQLEKARYLVKADGNGGLIYATSNKRVETPIDRSMRKPDVYIYALDLEGNLYIAKEGDFDLNQPNFRLQHPSFSSGGRLLAAGTIEIKNGKVIYIDNASGHYIPGEFSLFKVISELKKMNVVDSSCKVDFATMDKNDTRYSEENGNHNADDYIAIAKKSFLSVVKSFPKKLFDHSQDNFFHNIWNETALGKIKINLDPSKPYHADCSFFLEKMNNFIKSCGQASNSKNISKKEAESYHYIRTVWLNILKDFRLCIDEMGEVTHDNIIKIMQRYLSSIFFDDKSKEQQLFTRLIFDFLVEIKKNENVKCFFSGKHIIESCMGYEAQIQYAQTLADKNPNNIIDKISKYKMFLLSTRFEKSMMTESELHDTELRNVRGIKK